MEETEAFIFMSACGRIGNGVGESLIVAPLISIVSRHYQQDLFRTIGFLEISGGLGFLLGPGIGLGLYKAAGYFFAAFIFAIIFFIFIQITKLNKKRLRTF